MSTTPHGRGPRDSGDSRDIRDSRSSDDVRDSRDSRDLRGDDDLRRRHGNDDRYVDDTRDDRYVDDTRHHGSDSRLTDDHPRRDHGAHDVTDRPVQGMADRRTVVAAEEAEYGGVKPGAAFFGWLSATGMAVILTALLAAAGTALGIANNTDLGEAASDATDNPEGVGIAGIIGLGVILLIAYYCGGYVAGRMARFQGARQGVAVWVWALIIAALVAVLGIVAGNEYNVLQQIDAFPRIPVDEGTLSTAGIIALVVALLSSLVGAILGGIAGVRYHRKVDRAGLAD